MHFLDALVPAMAPLPREAIDFIIQKEWKKRTPSSLGELREYLFDLLRRVDHARNQAYRSIQPVVESGKSITSAWFVEEIRALSKITKNTPISDEIVNQMKKKGTLESVEWNSLTPSTTAAGLILRTVMDPLTIERAWYPPRVENPGWFFWEQDAPSQPIVPCQIPFRTPRVLTSKRMESGKVLEVQQRKHRKEVAVRIATFPPLKKSTLQLTTWLGAKWEGGWTQITDLGCVRFASFDELGSQQFDLEKKEVGIWAPDVARVFGPVLDREKHDEMRQTIIKMALMQAGESGLQALHHSLHNWSPLV